MVLLLFQYISFIRFSPEIHRETALFEFKRPFILDEFLARCRIFPQVSFPSLSQGP